MRMKAVFTMSLLFHFLWPVSLPAQTLQLPKKFDAQAANRPMAPGKTPSRLLALDCHESKLNTVKYLNRGVTMREIVRQAVLIAAREEIGLQTRDVILGEQFPDTIFGTKNILKVFPKIGRDGSLTVSLFRQAPHTPKIIEHHNSKFSVFNAMESLVTEMEQQSRKNLRAALIKDGFEAKPTPFRDTGDVPGELKNKLNEVNFIAQFQAVRALHKLLREEGASPQRLGAIARGYAHLGYLTQPNFNGAFAAYRARALLYAERAVQHWPDDPDSYLARGYARAVVGRHFSAIEDFEKVQALLKEKGIKDVPTWAKWAKLYVEGDSRLHAVDASESDVAIARLFAHMQVEKFNGAVSIKAIEQLLETSPDCFCAITSLGRLQGLSNRRVSAQVADLRFHLDFYKRLKSWEDAPKSLASLIRKSDLTSRESEQTTRIELMKTLHKLGMPESDVGEPSFSAFSSLVEEASFNQVDNEVELLFSSYGSPADELRKSRESLVVKPVYREYLRLHADDPAERQAAVAELNRTYDHVTFSGSSYNIFMRMRQTSSQVRDPYFDAEFHYDSVFFDLWSLNYMGSSPAIPDYKRELMRVCPHMPAVVIEDIKLNWRAIEPRLDEYKEKYWNMPPVLNALAKQCGANGEWEKQVALLRRQAEIAPDQGVITEIVNAVWRNEKGDRWKDIIDHYLKELPPMGLTQAGLQTDAAKKLILERRWDEATVYADKAAVSYSGWALVTAAECAEAKQDWKKAESYYKAVSLRYSGFAPYWYFFCRRTGKGDLEGATQLRDKFIAQYKDKPGSNLLMFANLAKLDESAKEAMAPVARYHSTNPYYSLVISFAILAHEAGDTDKRETSLTVARTLARNPRELAFTTMVYDMLVKQEKPEIDEEALNEILKQANEEDRLAMRFTIARIADHSKQKELAMKYYTQAMASPSISNIARTRAGARLLELGVTPGDYRDLVLQGEDQKEE